MNYFDLLNAIIEKGIVAAKRDYSQERHRQKLEGALAGFEACRDKNVSFLKELLNQARTRASTHSSMSHFWYYATFRAEVEWVCKCISVIELNEKRPVIVQPTARSLSTILEILREQDIQNYLSI